MQLTRAQARARELMDYHGLQQWSFGFDRAVRRAGQCNYDQRRITLSRRLVELWEEADVEQIILHEIAHALAGKAAKHGRKWQDIARKIGVHSPRASYRDKPQVPPRWVGYCPAGHAHYRYQRPGRASSCVRCYPRFSRQFLISWQPYDTVPAGEKIAE